MPMKVEKITRHEVSGWGYDDLAPERILTARVYLRGEMVGEARVDLSRGHQADIDGGYRRGFVIAVSDLGNIISALADGNLTIVAQHNGEQGDPPAAPITATFERNLLVHETLCTGPDLFGELDLDEIFDQLQTIRQRSESDFHLKAFCFDVINFIRAYFPPHLRGLHFYTVASEISQAAGMTHAASHYAKQREQGGIAQPKANDSVISASALEEIPAVDYALLGDLVRYSDLAPIDFTVPPFINGLPDTSFLLDCGVIGHARAEMPSIKAYGFRVNGFGDNDWAVTGASGRVDVAEKLYRVDFEVLRQIIDAGSIMVLDMSAEGPPCQAHWNDILNTALADLAIPANQLLLVTQNIAFATASRAQGLQVTSATAHFYLKRGSDIVAELFGGEAMMLDYMRSLLTRRAESRNARKYVCLNYTPRWSRWATVLSLYCNNHLESGFVSFPGVGNRKLRLAKPEAYGMPNIRNRERYIAAVPALLARCPLVVDVDSESWPAPDFIFPTKAFENSFLHIVTETEMSEGSVHRVTEKILKPIVGLQPFLVMGNPKSLQIMRDLGFRTFGSIIDESYDATIEIADRFDAVEHEMLRLLDQDLETLKRTTDAVIDILVHNFVHLVRTGSLMFGAAVEGRLRAAIAGMRRGTLL